MILIDGDACKFISLTEEFAKKHNIPCHIFCDTHHSIKSDYSEIHIVDKGRDATDFAIINKCKVNDIVITNDSGLAAMVLAKNGIAINTRGFEYTKNNIMSYLTSRHIRKNSSRKNNTYQVKGMGGIRKPLYNNYLYVLKKAFSRIETL